MWLTNKPPKIKTVKHFTLTIKIKTKKKPLKLDLLYNTLFLALQKHHLQMMSERFVLFSLWLVTFRYSRGWISDFKMREMLSQADVRESLWCDGLPFVKCSTSPAVISLIYIWQVPNQCSTQTGMPDGEKEHLKGRSLVGTRMPGDTSLNVRACLSVFSFFLLKYDNSNRSEWFIFHAHPWKLTRNRSHHWTNTEHVKRFIIFSPKCWILTKTLIKHAQRHFWFPVNDRSINTAVYCPMSKRSC